MSLSGGRPLKSCHAAKPVRPDNTAGAKDDANSGASAEQKIIPQHLLFAESSLSGSSVAPA
jgi:hypothetical protein